MPEENPAIRVLHAVAVGDSALVDVVGFAGGEATIGTGDTSIEALEDALINIERLRALLTIELVRERMNEAVRRAIEP